jgi:histidine triad (HIT) family protein
MKQDDCIFCKIVAGTIPAKILTEDLNCIVIEDRNPIAPKHFLVISREHFDNLGYATVDPAVLGWMLDTVDNLARKHNLDKDDEGYRVIINTGKNAGQTVKHLHMHVVGGAPLKNDFGAQ